MNIFKRIYCRSFQLIFKALLPFLPYRDPIIIENIVDIPRVLKEQGKNCPCIITDENIYKLGLTKILEEALIKNGFDYALFNKVVINPTTDNVNEALEIYRNKGCDCLIAFGGGSPMDCAKGVGAKVARPKKDLIRLKGVLKVRRKIPLLIAIPTTAGTGSETTIAAVIVDSKTRYKYAIVDFVLIPNYAVLDAKVTETLPPQIVATTGMDALTHAIEAYIGRSGNKETRKHALKAMQLIFDNLEKAYLEPNEKTRKNMLLASHLAGKAFSKAYVGNVHALAHTLGGKYNTPHGLANAVILPLVLRAYGKVIYKKIYEIAVYCNLVSEDVSYQKAFEVLITRIENMNLIFNLPKTLDVKPKDLDELSHHADVEANPLYPVPVLWDKKKFKEMLKKIGGINN